MNGKRKCGAGEWLIFAAGLGLGKTTQTPWNQNPKIPPFSKLYKFIPYSLHLFPGSCNCAAKTVVLIFGQGIHKIYGTLYAQQIYLLYIYLCGGGIQKFSCWLLMPLREGLALEKASQRFVGLHSHIQTSEQQ